MLEVGKAQRTLFVARYLFDRWRRRGWLPSSAAAMSGRVW